jgi:hypothetical protein
MRRCLWLLLILATAATASAQPKRVLGVRKVRAAPRQKERVFAVYTQVDRDGDGVLSAAEWEAARRAFPKGEAPDFKEADADGDGVVDRMEVRVLLGEPARPTTVGRDSDEEPADAPAEPATGPGPRARWGRIVFPTRPDAFAQWARIRRKDVLTLVRDGNWMSAHVHLVESILDDWHAAIEYPDVVYEMFAHVEFWVANRGLTGRYVTKERLKTFEKRHRNYAGHLRARFLKILDAVSRKDRRRPNRRGPGRPEPRPGPVGPPD